ncbi:MAG: GNAT family N-acetyltransferase [Provencibacterium sp.]|jgi:predicted acetyltransferase|nr:GNAT family N-acetyltransferase [Provencibacterium sp.]
MKFVFPCKEYERQAAAYIQEFERYASPVNGAGGLENYLKEGGYDRWLQKILADVDIANIPEGRVPALTYFYVREEDGEIIGMISLRLMLNDFLRREGGHIGYSIRPTQRRKGYGARMLREALRFFRPLIGGPILISCDKENPASAGVIRNCGGQLEAEFYSDVFQGVIQRYRMDPIHDA